MEIMIVYRNIFALTSPPVPVRYPYRTLAK